MTGIKRRRAAAQVAAGLLAVVLAAAAVAGWMQASRDNAQIAQLRRHVAVYNEVCVTNTQAGIARDYYYPCTSDGRAALAELRP